MFNDAPRQTVVVAENYQKMHELHLDLSSMVDEGLLFSFPPWETLPYEFISPPETTERERITALYRLIRNEPALVVTTVESLIRKIPDRGFFERKGVLLEAGGDYPFDDIVEMLAAYGYSREKRVDSFGHFAVKGGIIDIFPPSHESPLRLDFFGDTLESIREFDINSQISGATLASVTIYPAQGAGPLREGARSAIPGPERGAGGGMDLPESIIEQIKAGLAHRR